MSHDPLACPKCGAPRRLLGARAVCPRCKKKAAPADVVKKAVDRTYQPPKKTTLSKSQQTRIINNFDQAAQAFAYCGGYPPEQREEIRESYIRAKAKLAEAMAMLTPPGPVTRGTK